MDRFNKSIQIKAQPTYHQEQYDIYGRQERDRGGGNASGAAAVAATRERARIAGNGARTLLPPASRPRCRRPAATGVVAGRGQGLSEASAGPAAPQGAPQRSAAPPQETISIPRGAARRFTGPRSATRRRPGRSG